MRKRNNGFVQFMFKVDPKNSVYNNKKGVAFKWVALWPGDMDIEGFKDLVYDVTDQYYIGDSLNEVDQMRLDRDISWADTEIEMALAGLYEGEPLTKETYDHFMNWRHRLDNGEEPNEEEFYEVQREGSL